MVVVGSLVGRGAQHLPVRSGQASRNQTGSKRLNQVGRGRLASLPGFWGCSPEERGGRAGLSQGDSGPMRQAPWAHLQAWTPGPGRRAVMR